MVLDIARPIEGTVTPIRDDVEVLPMPPNKAFADNLLAEVMAKFHRGRIYYSGFVAECQKAEKYYNVKYNVPMPQDYKGDPIKPATARAKIDVATDHVDVGNPEIFVPEPSPRAKDRSERIQKFLQGVWMNIPLHIMKTSVRHQFLYGTGFIKTMFDSDNWPDEPQPFMFDNEEGYKEALKSFLDQKDISFPLMVKNVNPQNLIWDDSRNGMSWAIEYYESTVEEIRHQYPEFVTPKRDGDIATYIEYWDKNVHGRIADRQWIWGPFFHGYGFLPYIQAIPARSTNWDIGPPHERYQGMLYPIYNLLDAEARLMTQYEVILRSYAWPSREFRGNRAEAENVESAYEISPGSNNIVTRGVEVSAADVPLPPQELLAQLANVRAGIEEATFPDVVRGSRPSGVSAGFGISVLAGMGRLVFGSYADATSRAMAVANQNFLKLIENVVRGKMTVRARSQVQNFDQSIEPDDIRGFYENVVALKAEAPEEREREAQLAMTLWNGGNGLITEYEGMRRVGITNPLDEMNQKAAEAVLRLLRPMQAEQLINQLNEQNNLAQQLARAGSLSGGGVGNRFFPGMSQGNRVGEADIQRRRIESRNQPSVFPEGQGGISLLGSLFGSSEGGSNRVPSGQTVGL